MSQLTRTASRTRARYLLAEPSARFFTDANLNDWCNDAVSDISLHAYCYQVMAPLLVTPNVSVYPWPTTIGSSSVNIIGIKTILNSNQIALTRISPDLIGKVSAKQDELCWCQWARYIFLSPVPMTASSMVIMCWAEAEQPTSGILNLPQPFHHLVPMYMAVRGFEAKRNYPMMERYQALYHAQLEKVTQSWHMADNPGVDFVKPGMPSVTVGQ